MTIQLVEHNPEWDRDYCSIVAALDQRFGSIILRYDHVGSTAVAGLAAKPKIHIDATLRRAADLAVAVGLARQDGYHDLGFLHSGEDYQLTFPANQTGARTPGFGPFRLGHRLCLCLPGSRQARDRLRFRDRLKADPELCTAYLDLKTNLARQFGPGGDWSGYNEGKSAFIRAALSTPSETPSDPT